MRDEPLLMQSPVQLARPSTRGRIEIQGPEAERIIFENLDGATQDQVQRRDRDLR